MPLTADPAFEQFRDIHVRWTRYYARLFSQLGLTLPKYALLSQLAHATPMPLTEASRRLMISKPAASTLASRLENEGLLKRTKHPSDRRSYLLQLTPKGRDKTERAQKTMLGILVSNFKGLPARQRRLIMQFYLRLLDSLETQCLTPARRRGPS